jgi:hypothetical protein
MKEKTNGGNSVPIREQREREESLSPEQLFTVCLRTQGVQTVLLIRLMNRLRNRTDLTNELTNELTEDLDQFLFLRIVCLTNLKGTVGLILVKGSDMRISIPFDLFSRSFTERSHFISSRSPTTLLVPSLVLFPQCST